MSGGDWIVVGILLVIPGAVMAALIVCFAIDVLSELLTLVAWLCGLARIKRRRYKRTIANIARLERELGIDGQEPTLHSLADEYRQRLSESDERLRSRA